MLYLTRALGEGVLIGTDIRVVVEAIYAPGTDGNMKFKVGIKAPEGVKILREELVHKPPTRAGATKQRPAKIKLTR